MGILANHVPTIEPLKPGVIEVIESAGQSKKWFGKLFKKNWRLYREIRINESWVQPPVALQTLYVITFVWDRDRICLYAENVKSMYSTPPISLR